MNIIELKNIYFEYEKGEPVLEDLSLSIEESECVVLKGDNGSGKTTLFRIINGLSFPGKGEYLYKGTAISAEYLKDNSRAKRFHKDIGYLFQNTDTMLFNSTVYDEVAFGPRQMGLNDEEVDRRVQDCLELFGIENLKDKVPYHLSGGQKKMVALASVMSLSPKILVLDEPFAGLDQKRQDHLISFLKELKAAGTTLIIATHKHEEIRDLSDKIVQI